MAAQGEACARVDDTGFAVMNAEVGERHGFGSDPIVVAYDAGVDCT